MARKVTTTMEDDLYRVIKEKGIKFADCLAKGAEILLKENDPKAHPPAIKRVEMTRLAISRLTDGELKAIIQILSNRGYNNTARTMIYKLIETKIGLPLTYRARSEVLKLVDRLYKVAREEGEIDDRLERFRDSEMDKVIPYINEEINTSFPNINGKLLKPNTIYKIAEKIKRKITTILSSNDISMMLSARFSPFYREDYTLADIERLTIA